MDTIFRLTSPRPEDIGNTSILKADFFSSKATMNNIHTVIKSRVDELRQTAQQEYEQKGISGYDQGKADGLLENADNVLETIMRSVEFIEHIEGSLVTLVMDTIRKVFEEMDPGERIVRIVNTALSTIKSQKEVVVRVAPSDEHAVFEKFSDTFHSSSRGGFLSIVADSRLEPATCLLETEYGVVDASLELQLKALDTAFREKIQF